MLFCTFFIIGNFVPHDKKPSGECALLFSFEAKLPRSALSFYGIFVLRSADAALRKKIFKKNKKISTHLLIMEVDFCPVLCIAKMPILQAFWAISHFVWYRSLSSNELQMV